eukprot:TRINITY_DN4028_c0_g2_i1.p1 TRINITY_DN4028_c0_g2~~TRINITY_DN4028_c0_g2_i1.p1  ORF type:complete len:321 (+),score=67.56 TRINITY_DN4028_c0_g2_i1:55-1017(+)
MAMPRESRLAPLCTNFLDSEEIRPRRRHSFGGYIPYYLSEEVKAIDECSHSDTTGSTLSEEVKAIDEPCHSDSDTTGSNLEYDGSDACTKSETGEESGQTDLSPGRQLSQALPEACLVPSAGIAALAAETAAAALAHFEACKAQWQSNEYGASSEQHAPSSSSDSADCDTCWPDTDDEWDGPSARMPVLPPQVAVQGATMLMPVALRASPETQVPKAASKNDKSGAPAPSSCWHWPGTPALNIEEYVLRLYELCGYSQRIFVFALAYISKAVERNPGKVSVCRETVHRLVLAAITVAAKYHDDEIRSNEFYAKAGGVAAG